MGIFSSSGDNNFLGIDIGNSSLKMVELSKKGKKVSLTNYGFSEKIEGADFTYSDDIEFLAKSIVKMKNDLKIKSNRASASLPSWAVFSSVINLYDVNKKKMSEQIIDESKKVIPLPLEEMVLDWKVIPKSSGGKKNDKNVEIFLTGSPKKLIKKYIDVFKEAKIVLSNLETETFSLIRALLGSDPSTVMMIEMGENSTDFSIVRNSIPFLNRSINVSGDSMTKKMASRMGVDFNEAEQFKMDLSLSFNSKKEIPEILVEVVKPIVDEVKYMTELFYSSNNEKIEKIILSGGGSILHGFASHLESVMNIKVLIGDPWFNISYPPEIRDVLTEVGPKLSVASGLALRGVDKK